MIKKETSEGAPAKDLGDPLLEEVREADRRDELARQRDQAAAERDEAADGRDLAAVQLEVEANGGDTAEALRAELQRVREQAAADRVAAASDRWKAANDRLWAARARSGAVEALKNAHLDDLTGAYRRGIGEEILSCEIERARRRDGRLVLALVDVDDLAEASDRAARAGRDELLQGVAAAIRASIRSYEPLIRLDEDRFGFAMSGVGADFAAERCSAIQARLARPPSRGRITVGIAELEQDDGLEDMVRRADAALVRARSQERQAAHRGSPSPRVAVELANRD